MKMKNWSKTIATVATAALFIGFSNAHCESDGEQGVQQEVEVSESALSLYNMDKILVGFVTQEDVVAKAAMHNFLFEFMRKSLFLEKLNEERILGVSYEALYGALSVNNLTFRLSKKWLERAEFAPEAEAELLWFKVALRDDASQIEELKKGLNEDQQKELLKMIYKNQIAKYQEFVTKHYVLLKRIQQIANDGFVIKVQQCRAFEGEHFCLEEVEGIAINALSDIMEDAKIKEILGLNEVTNELPRVVIDDILSFTETEDKCEYDEELFEEPATININVKEAYDEAKPIIKEAYSEIKESLKEARTGVKNSIKKAGKNLKNTFKKKK